MNRKFVGLLALAGIAVGLSTLVPQAEAGLFSRLFGGHKHHKHCAPACGWADHCCPPVVDHCCPPVCAPVAPVSAAPVHVAPTCVAPAPACCAPVPACGGWGAPPVDLHHAPPIDPEIEPAPEPVEA